MTIIIVEPFCGGSHAQLVDLLVAWAKQQAGSEVLVFSLPAKKWHWRLLAGSAWAAQALPTVTKDSTLFCSSMLNLAELLALRPDLLPLRKVVYFHENQLEYPRRQLAADAQEKSHQSDFSIGWAQILSASVADVVAFNSVWNMQSFLAGLSRHTSLMPDKRQHCDSYFHASLASKCVVLYYPVEVPGEILEPRAILDRSAALPSEEPLRIAWPHRWEWDKHPEEFFGALDWLMNKKRDFRVVVTGEAFAEVPPLFTVTHTALMNAGKIAHWGYMPDKVAYYRMLSSCDVVLSTAVHEFFGVAIVEAVCCGCIPLCPASLSYLELLAPTPRELQVTSAVAVQDAVRRALRPVEEARAASLGSSTCTMEATVGPTTASPGSSATSGAQPNASPGSSSKRVSPLLYHSSRDLRRTLYAYCTHPHQLRLLRRQWEASITGDFVRSTVEASATPPEQPANETRAGETMRLDDIPASAAGAAPHEALMPLMQHAILDAMLQLRARVSPSSLRECYRTLLY